MKRIRSEESFAVLDSDSRVNRAKKILKVLKHNVDREFDNLKVLDIGTGSGHIAHEFSKEFKEVHSVDIVDERLIKDGYIYKKTTSVKIPYEEKTFDLVVTNHVIEHVSEQQEHLDEIYRVLKPNGIMYLATPNRFGPLDPHYDLPVVSWLPRKVTSSIFSVFGKFWDIYPVSMSELAEMIDDLFETNLISLEIIRFPDKYGLHKNIFTKIGKYIPYFILEILKNFLPTIVIVSKKK